MRGMVAVLVGAWGCAAAVVPSAAPLVPVAVLDEPSHAPVALPAGIVVADHGSMCLPVADPDALDAAEGQLAAVLAIYPPRVLEAARIERVMLCARLDTTPAAVGLASAWEHTIRIDITTPELAAVVHHEVFHMLELAPATAEADDREWDAANPPGFVYGAEPKARPAGFVNAYAATAASEDRASTYEYLMAHGEELCALARHDRVVRDKVRIIWARVAAVAGDGFLRAQAPCFDALAIDVSRR